MIKEQCPSRIVIVMADDLGVDRALEAVARTRAHGLHLLGHFVGVSGRPSPAGEVRLTLAAPTEDGRERTRPLPLLAFCTFADLVVGSAIRSHVGAGARLGTVTLSIQHRLVSARGELVGTGFSPPPQDGYGTAYAVFTLGDEVVGHANASSAVLPAPPGRTLQPLPWELDPLPAVPAVTLDDVRPDESQFVANVRAAHARAAVAGTSVEDELLHFDWDPAEPGRAHGALAIGPELSNRVGHLQGGALYAAAASAAHRSLGEGRWDLVQGSYQFLRPGDGRVLTAHAETLRQGSAMAFVHVDLSVDETAVGVGLFTFRRAAARSEGC